MVGGYYLLSRILCFVIFRNYCFLDVRMVYLGVVYGVVVYSVLVNLVIVYEF